VTINEQLQLWVKGDSQHNPDRDECCPDFSCCNEKVSTPLETRQAFVNGDEKIRTEMLGMFLGNAIQAYLGNGKKVDILVERNYGKPEN